MTHLLEVKRGKKVKRKPSEWEKIIANERTDKGLIFKIHKQLIQLNARERNNSMPDKETTQSKSGRKA